MRRLKRWRHVHRKGAVRVAVSCRCMALLLYKRDDSDFIIYLNEEYCVQYPKTTEHGTRFCAPSDENTVLRLYCLCTY